MPLGRHAQQVQVEAGAIDNRAGFSCGFYRGVQQWMHEGRRYDA